MPNNLEIKKHVLHFVPGNVVTDHDVQLNGAASQDWLNAGIAVRTDKERTEGLQTHGVPGAEDAARMRAEAATQRTTTYGPGPATAPASPPAPAPRQPK